MAKLERGVYPAFCGETRAWLTVLSDGRYWVMLDEGLRDPHVVARLGRALDELDPLPDRSPAAGAARSRRGAPRVLPFPPQSAEDAPPLGPGGGSDGGVKPRPRAAVTRKSSPYLCLQ